ncbi:MAG: sprT domain-containing protein, partial [Flavobacteriales bacterium]|nr:sprT domain-containing protein [Flavobacteriales bacterium]
DVQLSLAFRNYDAQSDDSVVLSDISIDTLFVTLSGRIFLKGPRQRKRYKCKEVKSGRLYLFSPITEVTPG